MKQLHQFATGADEDKHVAVAHVTSHLLMHHAAERADALAHVGPSRAKPVAHRVIQTEHDSQGFYPTIRAATLMYRCKNELGGHWETEVWHRMERMP